MNQITLMKFLAKEQKDTDEFVSLERYQSVGTEKLVPLLEELKEKGYVKYEVPFKGHTGGVYIPGKSDLVTVPAKKGALKAKLTIDGKDYLRNLKKEKRINPGWLILIASIISIILYIYFNNKS
tara:strand:- start:34112 stop:34483 length:372 start_codon:yes stop_codon:yes gene_type:complete